MPTYPRNLLHTFFITIRHGRASCVPSTHAAHRLQQVSADPTASQVIRSSATASNQSITTPFTYDRWISGEVVTCEFSGRRRQFKNDRL